MHPADVPDLRARELVTILALAEYGSFVAAAAYLRTSQPALTRAVKRIERIVGVTLFARSTRRVEITPAGREFVAVAARVVKDLERTVRGIGQAAHEPQERVSLSTCTVSSYWLPTLIGRYRETHPEVELRIREGGQADVIEDVRSGLCDFGIGCISTVPEPLDSHRLHREPLHVLIPTAHRLAVRRRRHVRLAELRDEQIISTPSDSAIRRALDSAAGAAGFTLRNGVTVDRSSTAISHVAAGVGFGIVPSGVLPAKPWNGFHAAILIDPMIKVSVGILTLRGRHMSGAAARMIAMIQQAQEGTVEREERESRVRRAG